MHVLPLELYVSHMEHYLILIYLKIIHFSGNYHAVLMPLYSIVISSVFFCCFFMTHMFENRNEFT